MRKKNIKLWNHLIKELNDFSVQAGWFEGSKYDAETPIAEIAALQNYGGQITQVVTDKQRAFLHFMGIHLKNSTRELNIVIPARPFMDNAKARVQGQEGKNILMQEMLRVFEGRQTMKIACDRLGLWLQGIIQEEIIKIQTPPLSKLTIENRKNRYKSTTKKTNAKTLAKPLVDTGVMLASVGNRTSLQEKY